MESRKMVQMNLFESTNRDRDLENKFTDTKGGGGGGWGMNWETGIDIHALLIFWIKQITKEKGVPIVQHRGLYSMLCGDL